jgi:hypothetical protein
MKGGFLIAYHAENSAEIDKTDMCEFWSPAVYVEMRDLLH